MTLLIVVSIPQVPRLATWTVSRVLGAEVTVDALSLGWERIEAMGVTVTRFDAVPQLDRFTATAVVIDGHWREWLGLHIQRLTVDGADIRLVPGPWPSTGDGPTPRIDTLTVSTGRVHFESAPDRTAVANLTVDLVGVGGALGGHIVLQAERMDIAPPLAVGGFPALDGDWAAPRIVLRPTAERLTVAVESDALAVIDPGWTRDAIANARFGPLAGTFELPWPVDPATAQGRVAAAIEGLDYRGPLAELEATAGTFALELGVDGPRPIRATLDVAAFDGSVGPRDDRIPLPPDLPHVRGAVHLGFTDGLPDLLDSQARVELDRFTVGPIEVDAAVVGLNLVKDTLGFEDILEFEDTTVTGTVSIPPLLPRPFELHTAGRLAPAGPSMALDLTRLEVELPGGQLQLTGRMPRLPGADGSQDLGWPAFEGLLTLDAFDLATWQGALAEPPPWSSDFALGGQLDGQLTLTSAPSSGLRASGTVALGGLGFTSEDGARVLEGLSIDAQVDASQPPEGPQTLELRGESQGFLLLWETFFGDFSALTTDWDVRITRTPEALSAAARLQALDGPRLAVEASKASDDPNVTVTGELRVDDLAALHRDLLLPGFGADRVGEALVGALGVDLRARFGPDRWTVDGTTRVVDGGFDSPTKSIDGLDLDLPFALRGAGLPWSNDSIDGPRSTGTVRFDQMALGDFEVPAVAGDLWTEGDTLGLVEDLRVPIYRGTAVLTRGRLADALGSSPTLVTGVRLQGLDLEAISTAFGVLPLAGTLDGHLPRVRLTDSTLEVDGGGEVQLFDGTVRVHSIAGTDVLTPYPRITVSADLSELDLGALTRQVDFGEMTGVLQGSIDDCVLFRWVPVQCEARFETVQRPGVPRTVDVKAVNNLTILGTGQGNLFDRGIRRLFKKFTYNKLWVDLELANDRLLLRGQPAQGNRELFLSGRLPFAIEVVNAQPGRSVSFQAMVKRLDSLDLEAVSTGSP